MAGSRRRIESKMSRRGGRYQCFTRAVAHKGYPADVALGICFQALVIASQFSAGLPPHSLIEEFKHHEIGFNVLTLIAMVKIG